MRIIKLNFNNGRHKVFCLDDVTIMEDAQNGNTNNY